MFFQYQTSRKSVQCGQTDMTKLTNAFRQYTNMSKKQKGFLQCGTNTFNHNLRGCLYNMGVYYIPWVGVAQSV